MTPFSSLSTPENPVQRTHAQLIQILLNLACPGAAHYVAHALRPDGVYRVVVQTIAGYQLISIPAPALVLTDLGVLVESDRHAIVLQLKPGSKQTTDRIGTESMLPN